jgi:hypothetical protein
MLATAAAVSVLLVGYPVTEKPNGPPAADEAFLNPATLQPKPGSPTTAPGFGFAVSPDQTLAASVSVKDFKLRIFRRSTGALTGTVKLPRQAAATSTTWLTRNRMLVIECAGYPTGAQCKRSTLQVIDPVKATIIHTRRLSNGVTDVTRAGRQALVMLAKTHGTNMGPKRLIVLDRNGRLVRTIRRAGVLSGNLVSSVDHVIANHQPSTISRVNPKTGAIRTRHFANTANFVLPRPDRAALVQNGLKRYEVIDLETLKTIHRFKTGDQVSSLPDGYLRADNDSLTAYSLRGKRRWSLPLTSFACAAIGRYLYVQQLLDSAGAASSHVDIFDVATGTLAGSAPGRYVLSTPGFEQSHVELGPPFDGSNEGD